MSVVTLFIPAGHAGLNGAILSHIDPSGDDEIESRNGDHTICGMGGNDMIYGQGGNDWVDGGEGNEEVETIRWMAMTVTILFGPL